tara:strand:- start:911 stop:1162 length:252 start_codon:yes stop_codon:yes gene_type:complete
MTSDKINLGQVNMSTDITMIGNVNDINIDLTLIVKRIFIKINNEKNTSVKFNNKKANCHSLAKKTLHNAISITGREKKNKLGR